jgi:hypothetical protein
MTCKVLVRNPNHAEPRSHADQVGGEASTAPHDMRNDVSPEIRRGGISAKKNNRIPRFNIDVAHF